MPVVDYGKAFLAGGGEMGAMMRAHDWSTSPAGPPEGWPQSLRSAVGLMLANKHIMFVAWGPELAFLYNDAYRPVFGQKHPWALGRPFREVWSEVWDEVEPLVKTALGGEATWSENLHLVLHRNGYPEDCWFTFSYSPVRDEDGAVVGLFCAATETTGQVRAERRLKEQVGRQRRLFEKAPGFIAILTGPDHIFEFVNEAYVQLVGRRDAVGRTVRQVFLDLEGQGLFELLDDVFTKGERFVAEGLSLTLQTSPDQPSRDVILDFIYEPIRDESDCVTGIFIEGHDVTEAHLARAALSETEGRFRALVNATANVVYRMAPDWRELRRLDGAGFIVDTEAPTTDWIETYIPADERPRLREAIERAFGAKDVFELEHRVLRADGTVGWAHSRAIPLLDDAGEIVEWFGAASDVTARVKADQSFTRLFEASPAPFLVLAPDAPRFTIREVNDAYLAATMRTREGVVGRGIFEAYPDNPNDATIGGQSRLRASLEHVLATRRPDELPSLHYDIARPDGTFEVRWWSPVNSPILDENGEVEAIIHNANDVTEQRCVEAALRATEARLRDLNQTLERRVAETLAERDRLWRASRDLYVAISMDGVYRDVNPAWTTELGYSKEQLIGTRFDARVHPDDVAATEAHFERVVGGGFAAGFEVRTLAADGSWRWYEWTCFVEGGTFFAMGRDAGERKASEEERRALEEQLRQAQKMEAMGNLTGGVAHDFNNLLTPILGSLDMLQRKGLGNEREQRLIAGALQSADRAKTLIQRLLAFARRQPLQTTSVDLTSLVRGMAELVSSTTGPQINVVVDASEGLPSASADPNQLEMAILNLAVNARDAMPEGGTLRITIDGETVGRQHRSNVTPGRYLRLSVADTGSGMDEATLSRAVEPFYSTKGVGKGTGLGLSMVHGLASQLGGALTINSTLGIGTNVELWLPQSAELLVFANPEAKATLVSKGSGTALLVDDEDLVRLSTADMLIDLGYAVVEAASAEEALKLVDRGLQPEVLITDHLMPGMTGTELARMLQGSRPGIKVLVVSGYAEAEGGASDLPRLTKPFRSVDLAESLAALG